MGRPILTHTGHSDSANKADWCAWHSLARRLRQQPEASTSASNSTVAETDVDAVLEGLCSAPPASPQCCAVSNPWPASARRQAVHGNPPRRESADRRPYYSPHLSWSDALEQFPLLDTDGPNASNRAGRLRLLSRRSTRDSDVSHEPWTPPPLPRAGSRPLPHDASGSAPAHSPTTSRALREHMRRQMDSTDVAQLAHGTLHLAGMDHVASRAALTDARQILEDLTQLIDERLFQEDIMQR